MTRHHAKILFLIFAAFWLLLTVWDAFAGIASKPWNSPAFNAYWLVKDLTGYLLVFWLLSGYAVYTGFKNLLDRALIELMRAWVVLAAIDRITTGNTLTNSLWDWHDTAIIGAALAYVLSTWWLCWRKSDSGDPIEPRRVYLASRPPRNLIEFIGTVFGRAQVGPVAYVLTLTGGGVFWYGPKGKFRIRYKPTIPKGLVFHDTGLNREQFHAIWGKIDGQKWTPRRNCFWMKRQIDKASKVFRAENQTVSAKS